MTCRGDPPSFGINYGSISFGQLLGCIVFCTGPIQGAKPPPKVKHKIQCDQKVGQKKWSRNLCLSWEDLPYMSFCPTVVNPLAFLYARHPRCEAQRREGLSDIGLL